MAPLLKQQNIMRADKDTARRWYEDARRLCDIYKQHYFKDIVPGIPFFVKASISVEGILVFLVGTDPAKS